MQCTYVKVLDSRMENEVGAYRNTCSRFMDITSWKKLNMCTAYLTKWVNRIPFFWIDIARGSSGGAWCSAKFELS